MESEAYRILVTPEGLLPDESGVSLLQRSSCDTRFAADGEEALAVCALWRPHLIMFGSMMQGVSVADFCARVRADRRLQGAQLLMVTELIGDERSQAAPPTIDAHVVNPVEDDQLDALIAELLQIPNRQAKRVDVELIARIEGCGADTSMTANIMNLSEAGMRIEAPDHLEIGASGLVRLVLPSTSELLSLSCTVRVAIDEILLHYGVELSDLTDAQRASLRDFVAREQRSDGE